MIILSSTNEIPMTMTRRQFPVGKLDLSKYLPELRYRTLEKAHAWGSSDFKQTENSYHTRSEYQEKLTEMFKQSYEEVDVLDTSPLKLLVDSGLRGDDIYECAKHSANFDSVWAAQVMVRGVEAYYLGCTFEEVPLVHPEIGCTYTCCVHSPRTVDKPYQIDVLKVNDKWCYLAVNHMGADLIAL